MVSVMAICGCSGELHSGLEVTMATHVVGLFFWVGGNPSSYKKIGPFDLPGLQLLQEANKCGFKCGNNIGAVVGRVYMQDASHNEDQHHKDVSGNSLLAAILCLAHHHIIVIWWRLFRR